MRNYLVVRVHSLTPPVYKGEILRSAYAVYLCVLCGSENKQRLFPYTALTDWFLSALYKVTNKNAFSEEDVRTSVT